MAKPLVCDYCHGVICPNLEYTAVDGLRTDKYTHIAVTVMVAVVSNDYGETQRTEQPRSLDACSTVCAGELLAQQGKDVMKELNKTRRVRQGPISAMPAEVGKGSK